LQLLLLLQMRSLLLLPVFSGFSLSLDQRFDSADLSANDFGASGHFLLRHELGQLYLKLIVLPRDERAILFPSSLEFSQLYFEKPYIFCVFVALPL
jgi:hypothetical protein